MDSPATAAGPPLLVWEAQEVSDESPRPDRRRELCHVAQDAEGCDWIVSPHDDGTWNWQRWDNGSPLVMGDGFKTDADALAAANRYAEEILR